MDTLPLSEPHVSWHRPIYCNFASFNIAIHPKMCIVTKDDFSATIGFLFQTTKTQSGNALRCLWSLPLSVWVSWILYGCRPKFRCKIHQVEVCERQICARHGIDCLGFSCTLSWTSTMFLAELDVQVLADCLLIQSSRIWLYITRTFKACTLEISYLRNQISLIH